MDERSNIVVFDFYNNYSRGIETKLLGQFFSMLPDGALLKRVEEGDYRMATRFYIEHPSLPTTIGMESLPRGSVVVHREDDGMTVVKEITWGATMEPSK